MTSDVSLNGYADNSLPVRPRRETLESTTHSLGMHPEIETLPSEDLESIRHNLIPQYLRLIDSSLRILGLLPHIPVKSTCVSYILYIYHIGVWFSSWSLFIVRFASYHFRLSQRQDLSIGVGVATLVTLYVISLKICVMIHVALEFAKKRKRIYALWEEYKITHGGDWEGPLRRRVFSTFLICWGLTLGYCILIWIVYFISDSSRHFQKEWVVFSSFPIIPDGFIADVLILVYNVFCICHPTAI
ncbi:hypothetical protein CAPTEDRAFT_190042, partial [Capitella teleta]